VLDLVECSPNGEIVLSRVLILCRCKQISKSMRKIVWAILVLLYY